MPFESASKHIIQPRGLNPQVNFPGGIERKRERLLISDTQGILPIKNTDWSLKAPLKVPGQSSMADSQLTASRIGIYNDCPGFGRQLLIDVLAPRSPSFSLAYL